MLSELMGTDGVRETPPETIERLRKRGIYDGAWAGQPAFVMAGGPSIQQHGFAISRLQGRGRIIAINRSIELPLEPDMWMWMDWQFYIKVSEGKLGEYAKLRQQNYKGIRVGRLPERNLKEDIFYVGWQRGTGASESLWTAHMGNNSGFWSFCWAHALGANPIVLFGYDYRPAGDGMYCWWHDGYGQPQKKPGSPFNRMRAMMENVSDEMTRGGREVWNCSQQTALKAYPIVPTLDELFDRLDAFGRVEEAEVA